MNNLIDKDITLKDLIKYLIFTLLFIAISGASFLILYEIVDEKDIFLSLNIFSNKLFIKIIVLITVYIILDSLRLYYVLRSIDVKISFKYIIKLSFIYIFISNVTPFATGGGFAQIYFLNKKGVSIGDASSASLIRTFLAFIFFIIIAPIIIILDSKIYNLFPKNISVSYLSLFTGIYIIVIYIFYNIIKKPKLIEKYIYNFFNFLNKKKILNDKKFNRYIEKAEKEIEKLSTNINNFLISNKRYVLLSIVFTLLFLLSFFYFSVILIKDLNPSISSLKIISAQIIITFIMYMSPTPGSTGVAEGGFTLLFSTFVTKGKILSVVFAWRLFSIYIPMIIGILLFSYEILVSKDKEVRPKNG